MITLKKAKNLSLIKWAWFAKTGAPIFELEDHPRYYTLMRLRFACGLCEYQTQRIDCEHLCVGCPLNLDKKEYGSPAEICCGGVFDDYITSRNMDERKAIASKIIDLIAKIEV